MVKSNTDSHYSGSLNRLRIIIGEKSRLGPPDAWKQRDFASLIDLIYKETRIHLSLSTLKRLWHKNYSGTPHPSTLDALAQYAGYDNWYAFRIETDDSEDHGVNPAERLNLSSARQSRVSRLITAILIILIIPLIIFIVYRLKEPSFSLAPHVMTCDSVPSQAVFRITARGNVKDSLFLVPSRRYRRSITVKPHQREVMCHYPVPGLYTATLFYGNRAADSAEVLIKTDGWLASVYNYNRMKGSSIEHYFSSGEISDNGRICLTGEKLASNGISVDGNLYTLYYYVAEPFKMDYDNFILETRVKADSIFNYPYPYFYLSLMTREGMEFIPFSVQGIEQDQSINFSDSFLEGNTNDLSSLTTRVYSWNDIRIENSDRHVKILINGKEAVSFTYKEPLEPICGFNFTFLGTGSIDRLVLLDDKGNTVFSLI
jgi:transcriptional regulator with XRE-family HTH domain